MHRKMRGSIDYFIEIPELFKKNMDKMSFEMKTTKRNEFLCSFLMCVCVCEFRDFTLDLVIDFNHFGTY